METLTLICSKTSTTYSIHETFRNNGEMFYHVLNHNTLHVIVRFYRNLTETSSGIAAVSPVEFSVTSMSTN